MVYVIIVTYNAEKWIQKCLESVNKYAVILIDNSSTDNTVSIVKKRFVNVEVIELKTNIGFGKANNIGIIKAIKKEADFIFLLNQDAYTDSDVIDKLIKCSIDNPEFRVISPFHLNGKKTDLDYYFKGYLSEENCPNYLSDLYFNRIRGIYEANFVNAAAWLLTRACIETVGGFNPVFFMYGEDDNYIQRLKFHSFKVGIMPEAKIYHDRVRAKKKAPDEFIQKLVEYSNPSNNTKIENDLDFLKKQILKNKLLLRSRRLNYYQKRLKFLKQFPADITRNKIRSRNSGLTFLE